MVLSMEMKDAKSVEEGKSFSAALLPSLPFFFFFRGIYVKRELGGPGSCEFSSVTDTLETGAQSIL